VDDPFRLWWRSCVEIDAAASKSRRCAPANGSIEGARSPASGDHCPGRRSPSIRRQLALAYRFTPVKVDEDAALLEQRDEAG
jgi:hypothetical protein